MKVLRTLCLTSLVFGSSLAFSALQATMGHTVHCRARLVDVTGASIGQITTKAVSENKLYIKVPVLEQDRKSHEEGEKALTTWKFEDLTKACERGFNLEIFHLQSTSGELNAAAEYKVQDIQMFVEIDEQELDLSGT